MEKIDLNKTDSNHKLQVPHLNYSYDMISVAIWQIIYVLYVQYMF